MTAGRGIVHSEMFPLINREESNPTELFQIWLNLPGQHKLADPHFSMFWAEDMPRIDPEGSKGVELVVVAGATEGTTPSPPPPASWASRAESNVAIWTVTMAPGARWRLPGDSPGLNRMLYFFAGQTLDVNGHTVARGHAIQLHSDAGIELENGAEPSELLLLQGRPIGEAVAQHGPFVMNTSEEIHRAISDYHATQFGGWPWGSDGPVHRRNEDRFARRPDGFVERPVGRYAV